MDRSPKEETATRRDFLKVAAAAAPAAAAATVMGSTEAEASAPRPEGHMQDTAHTRAYFDSARF